jgi:hypothetical protein
LDDEKAHLILEANVADGTGPPFETGRERETGKRETGREIARETNMENENGIVRENATETGIGIKMRKRGTGTATGTVIGIVERKKTVTVTAGRSETPQAGALFPSPLPQPTIGACPLDQTHPDTEMDLIQRTYLGRDEDLLTTRCVNRSLQSDAGLIKHNYVSLIGLLNAAPAKTPTVTIGAVDRQKRILTKDLGNLTDEEGIARTLILTG